MLSFYRSIGKIQGKSMRERRSANRAWNWIGAAGVLCLANFMATAEPASPACPPDPAGLHLPAGFCATIFADGIGHARHLVVAPNGVVYVNTWSGRYFGNDVPHAGGFLVALQDTRGAGTADVTRRFGETAQDGGAGGTGIGLYKGALYAEINDRIVRYALTPGSIVPHDPPTTVVKGLPLTGDHPMHPFAIDADGSMYVDVASATNACQLANRKAGSPGADPCEELKTRGGIWRYDANMTGQIFSPAARYATGIRNAEGFGVDSAGHRLFVTQHGRDQLRTNWPTLYQPDQEATLPAEELLSLRKSGDYGWPECYFDPVKGKLVLAPEYGGDGGTNLGSCAGKIAPIATFPAHWAPDGMTFYDKDQFPGRYRNGVFIAFHGSWNRAPFPQSGYNVVYQSLDGAKAGGTCEIFADGFAGPVKSPGQAEHRPTGIAAGPDGSLYVSDDVRGRIYKIVYRNEAGSAGGNPPGGDPPGGDPRITPCPNAAAAATDLAVVGVGTAQPDEHGADAAADLPVAVGATRAMVALGNEIYHGRVGGAACSGCHGATATGTALGPDLTGAAWLWSDGSYSGIAKTIESGVMQPKKFRNPMPPMGGAQLDPNQLSAVAAYVWGVSHRSN
jgi:glucose/arabinose dehydrogenase/mono/diheme cytochrome c family protein